MRVWLLVVLSIALLTLTCASAMAVPSLGGPTGLVMLPNAEIASADEWHVGFGHRNFAADFLVDDISIWTFTGSKGVADDAELWLAYQRADGNIWEFGGKYQISENLLPNIDLLAGTQVSVGGSLGRWADAFQMYNEGINYSTLGFTKLYLVATKQLHPATTTEHWRWSPQQGTSIIGSAGLMYMRLNPSEVSSETLVRPFFGAEIVGASGLALVAEYRLKDSSSEAKAPFSVALKKPLDEATSVEVGLTNTSPVGLGDGDSKLFWRMTYSIPAIAWK